VRKAASLLSPFGYVQLLWAAVLGGVVFGEVPDR
jgi:drug/metabolite transporter (DMT)-like permease